MNVCKEKTKHNLLQFQRDVEFLLIICPFQVCVPLVVDGKNSTSLDSTTMCIQAFVHDENHRNKWKRNIMNGLNQDVTSIVMGYMTGYNTYSMDKESFERYFWEWKFDTQCHYLLPIWGTCDFVTHVSVEKQDNSTEIPCVCNEYGVLFTSSYNPIDHRYYFKQQLALPLLHTGTSLYWICYGKNLQGRVHYVCDPQRLRTLMFSMQQRVDTMT